MYEDIVKSGNQEISTLKRSILSGGHIKTGDIRNLSAKLYKIVPDKSIDGVLKICEILLEEYNWELGVIAFDWANRIRKYYTIETYDVFYSWLKKYVRGWGDCDDFCTHAFGQLLIQQKDIFRKILNWTKDEDFWVRRASAVILIPAILKDDYAGIHPLEIANKLLNDENDLVCKGYGWMLKSLSKVDEELVIEYLEKKHSIMPRVSFRYAIEKINAEKRQYLMEL
ncbi:DNA alkylation repair protein [Clostridium estertheticum]|uniref:DNA alkylation repair protein n=2 Tax=Clostridium estertheticum TaxID=238834 RepID=UPI001C0C586A|nr:DNA alkylation repair protein [Clostridium estertheticum]MBU3073074.1 DNA alkylation repair protein [Clostridium estertheticum]MBU3162889.1 DNA alkylation repair protein [Clostridium estertheticum]